MPDTNQYVIPSGNCLSVLKQELAIKGTYSKGVMEQIPETKKTAHILLAHAP